MKIILNGQSKDIPNPLNLTDMVHLFVRDKTPVVAEVNGKIIQAAQWSHTPLSDGDRVELVRFMGGGSR